MPLTMDKPLISYFKNISDKKPVSVTLEFFIDLVRSTQEYPTILAVRRASTKEEANKYKKTLSAVTLSGEFAGGHSIDKLVKHSGYMQIDFDNLQNVKEIKSKLIADKHTLACFISPSGKGVKGVVKIADEHLQAFESLQSYYLETYGLEMDKVCKDVTRLCFTSFDQDAFYNEKAETFTNQSFTPCVVEPVKQTPKTLVRPQNYEPNDVYKDVEKVVNQINLYQIDITNNYQNWLNIGFALASEFGENGRTFFHSVSSCNPSYKSEETDKQYTECCKGRKSGISIKTLFGYAKDHGLDIKPVRPQNNNYQKPKQVANKPVEKETKHEYSEAENEPENELLSPIKMDSDNIQDMVNEYGFFHKDGKYYVRETRHNKQFDIDISNFLMEILYQFDDGTNDTKRLIKIQKNNGTISIKEVLDSQTSTDRFETILKSVGCSFLGSTYNLKKIYVALMDKERKANAITQLGYNKEYDLYALSDAVIINGKVKTINKIGIINEGEKCFYLPAWSETNINNKGFNNERRFRWKEGNLNFESWSKLVYEAFDIKGAIGMMYLINTLFFDVIMKELNFFPFLYLFGQAGGGKTTYIDCLLHIFGDKDMGTPAVGSTDKAIARICGQKANALTYIKEFDKNVSAMLIPMMKSFYDGVSYSTAQTSNDNKTNSFDITSGLIIDGNVLPIHEPAFFDRFIILQFEDNKFTEANKKGYEMLVKEYDNGFGRVFLEIWQHREHFKKEFKAAFQCAENQLKGIKSNYNGEVYDEGELIIDGFNCARLPERNRKHIAFICSTYYVLHKKIKFPFSWAELVQKVISDAIEKNDMLTEIKDVNVFWDSVNYTTTTSNINAYYFKDVISSTLYIKISELYPFYVEYCKKSMINAVDKQTLIKLLTIEASGFIPNTTQKGRGKAYTKDGFGSCYRFRFQQINNNIEIAGKEVFI